MGRTHYDESAPLAQSEHALNLRAGIIPEAYESCYTEGGESSAMGIAEETAHSHET
jgi:hypothetical protein